MFNSLLKRYKADVLDPDISSIIYEAVNGFFKKISKKLKNSESSEDSDNSKFWKTWKELKPYEKRVSIVGVIGAIFLEFGE